MRIPSRRTFWLNAATLLLAIVVCGSFLVPRSRINQENFDRIQRGMSRDEVARILGEPMALTRYKLPGTSFNGCLWWEDGLDFVLLEFRDGKVLYKTGGFATPWQTVQWYAKQGAEKIGIKWQ